MYKLLLAGFILVVTFNLLLPRILKRVEDRHRSYVNRIHFSAVEEEPHGECTICGKFPATRFIQRTGGAVCNNPNCEKQRVLENQQVDSYIDVDIPFGQQQ